MSKAYLGFDYKKAIKDGSYESYMRHEHSYYLRHEHSCGMAQYKSNDWLYSLVTLFTLPCYNTKFAFTAKQNNIKGFM